MGANKGERRASGPLERLWPEDRTEQSFRDMFRSLMSTEGIDRMWGGAHLVKVEESVDDGFYVIRAELPGMDPERDVEISMADGLLHINAEREERSEDDRGEAYRSEFRYGRFERSLRLPEGTSQDDITASYKDGILEVRVPVKQQSEKAAAARIPVQKG